MPPSNSADPVAPAPLALTMGEPAGIGGEIALQAWLRRDREQLPPFFVLDDPARLEEIATRFGWQVPLQQIASPAETNSCFATALPVLPVPLAAPARPGRPDTANAPMVLQAIEQAVAFARNGAAGAVVTNPIHKAALYAAGFRHPGHTEYLAALCGGVTPVMMLASDRLRVVPVTIHVSLRQAIALLTTDLIVETARITAADLRDKFGIPRPRLAVAGLNPHAGEAGAMGDEDAAIVAPAVERLRAEGLDVSGPLPPDTMFHAAARAGYDAAICMYHDQALIPIKTLDFDQGVNVTLGLPIIRTSPDHGTAFDIAGQGIASADSLVAALKMAGAMARHRQYVRSH
ncbi:4-hydroxythreonine-4-phosphate dehydrogenase PdxA [Ferrovibrio xuzhouensis]|uniref:4-hydroxythreonine-4-phosphate dehydrogenase n=1 Tax=Ferrovibrio xuzhouensis TaxID=1576914 RepID=A0ABV7VIT3_9PROT